MPPAPAFIQALDLIVLAIKNLGNLYRQTPKKLKHSELNLTLESLKLMSWWCICSTA
jgi:hypothetical protein